MARLVFLSCHLSGTGHLVRILTLAQTAAARGHDVLVLNGGRALDHIPTGGVEVVNLPPVTIRGLEFGTLRKPDGAPVDPAYMTRRRDAIAAALQAKPAQALITELFPFGRRVLAEEFLSAIGLARSRGAAIVCSVRDIPEPKPKRLAEVADRLASLYDGVLVHGDADFVPLSATWPLPDLSRVHHVGYLGRAMPTAPRGPDILVSCGGGVLGRQIARFASDAAILSNRPWRILIGGTDRQAVADDLQSSRAAPNLTVEPVRPDFQHLLAAAACSISLCGYNTAVDLAQCETPAILIPSTEGDEREQSLRAGAFERFTGFRVLPDRGLDPGQIAALAGQMAETGPRPIAPLYVDAGERAVRRIETTLSERQST